MMASSTSPYAEAWAIRLESIKRKIWIGNVSCPAEYTTTEALSSATVVVYTSTPAAAIEGSINGNTALKKVCSGGTPRLTDASSIESGML